ncbi:MAG: helix-turn-helix domain-containing protein [Lactovum sp.]
MNNLTFNNTSLAERIKTLRKRKDMSIQTLSSCFDSPVPISLISYWEAGKRKPSFMRLKELAKIFEVPILWLLYGNDQIDAGGLFSSSLEKLNLLEMTMKEWDDQEGLALNYESLAKRMEISIEKTYDQWLWYYIASYPGYPNGYDDDLGFPKYPGFPYEEHENEDLEYTGCSDPDQFDF